MRPPVRIARRVIASIVFALALAAAAGSARAEVTPPPLPPVPPPPVQVPTVPLPRVPQTPTLPSPPRVPRSAPAPSVPTPATPSLPGVSGGTHGGSSQSGTSSSGRETGSGAAGGASGNAQSGSAAAPRPTRVTTARGWISRSGPQSKRRTTLTFVLRRAGIVEFVVVRVAPDCTRVGTLRVRGRVGVNRITFRGRIAGRPLRPGTYELRAHGVRTRLVIFRRAPTTAELSAAESSNTCPAASGGSGSGTATGAGQPRAGDEGGFNAGGAPAAAGARPDDRTGSRERSAERAGRAGVLGVRFTRAADAVREVSPVLFAVLGLAIALLAAAALPSRWIPNAKAAAVLAYRRSLVALAGAVALVSVAVAYVLA